jgi:hypothetical protein
MAIIGVLSHSPAAETCQTWIASEAHRTEILNVAETAMRAAGKEILKLRQSKDFSFETKEHFADLKTAGDCGSQPILMGSALLIFGSIDQIQVREAILPAHRQARRS